MTEKELDAFVASVVPGRGGKEPPDEENGEVVMSDKVINGAVVETRTVCEQVVDVSPMFKRLKKKIKEYTTADV